MFFFKIDVLVRYTKLLKLLAILLVCLRTLHGVAFFLNYYAVIV